MDDISVYVLKPFPFSRNGVEEEFASAGQTLPIPARLFGGLNKEGYVRRAEIGDGHFTLHPSSAAEQAPVVTDTGDDPDQAKSDEDAEKTTPAPQPPVKTSDLSSEEEAALADGSWKDRKFFWKRSVAAKVSSDPIADGPSAEAAIEAYIAAQKA